MKTVARPPTVTEGMMAGRRARNASTRLGAMSQACQSRTANKKGGGGLSWHGEIPVYLIAVEHCTRLYSRIDLGICRLVCNWIDWRGHEGANSERQPDTKADGQKRSEVAGNVSLHGGLTPKLSRLVWRSKQHGKLYLPCCLWSDTSSA
jgi:hypothetical protein